jgi:hypothetical protein
MAIGPALHLSSRAMGISSQMRMSWRISVADWTLIYLACLVVLVHTSVWIRFLAGREPYASKLDGLLSNDEVLGHDFVYGELLIGDRGGRDKLLPAMR